MGPFGSESVWSWVTLFFGHPLNLVLYIPFRIFAYSSDVTTKGTWEKVCTYLDSGLDNVRTKIIPNVIIDFLFGDTGPCGLNLTKGEDLFECG